MKTHKWFLIFLLIFFPVTVFSQGYLGKSCYSVINSAKEIYHSYNLDGSITDEARSMLLMELSKLYGSKQNPIDTEEVTKIILDKKFLNLPIINLLNRKRFSELAENYEVKSSRVAGMTFFINVLGDILMDKVSTAAKSTIFTLFLNTIFSGQEMQILFPNTSGFFNTLSQYKLKASPRIFAESFKSDLQGIPFNIPNIFYQAKGYRDTLKHHPHIRLFLEANRYYKELKNLRPIYQINNITLNNLYDIIQDTSNTYSELYNSLKLMQYVYFQFLNESSDNSLVSRGFLKNVREMRENKVLQDLYLGLICAQNPNIEFAIRKANNTIGSGGEKGGSVQFVQMSPIINLMRRNDSHKVLMNYLYNYAFLDSVTSKISDSIYTLREYDEPVSEEIKDLYFDKSIEFMQYALDPSNLYPEGDYDKSETDLFIDLIKKYKALEKNIENGQNLAALMNTFYIYGEICKSDSSFASIYKDVSGNVLNGISIVADLLSAKNDEDIAKIVSDHIFSNTDANAKKESNFSLLLNSYGGIYYGKQFDNVRNNWTRNRGIMAPIGFELSKGFKDFGNLSLFVPLLDLGAIIDFKLSSDSTETVTKLEMDNIISPGLYLTYGFPKIPVSVGGGFQFSPHLSKITLNGNVIEPRKLRWNLFLAFDLPLLRIF